MLNSSLWACGLPSVEALKFFKSLGSAKVMNFCLYKNCATIWFNTRITQCDSSYSYRYIGIALLIQAQGIIAYEYVETAWGVPSDNSIWDQANEKVNHINALFVRTSNKRFGNLYATFVNLSSFQMTSMILPKCKWTELTVIWLLQAALILTSDCLNKPGMNHHLSICWWQMLWFSKKQEFASHVYSSTLHPQCHPRTPR